jgi:hypothetical protein
LVGARGSWLCEVVAEGVFESGSDSGEGLPEGEAVHAYFICGGQVTTENAEKSEVSFLERKKPPLRDGAKAGEGSGL